jgi:hypothetical protein
MCPLCLWICLLHPWVLPLFLVLSSPSLRRNLLDGALVWRHQLLSRQRCLQLSF